MSSNQEPPVKIRLLGTFEVGKGDRVIHAENWPRKKAAALLKRLALERRLLKDQAIEFLWPETSLDSAANNLNSTLHSLRRTLDKYLGPRAAEGIIRFEDGWLIKSHPAFDDHFQPW
jgi:DNA-binding SARP family transcriptional activator